MQTSHGRENRPVLVIRNRRSKAMIVDARSFISPYVYSLGLRNKAELSSLLSNYFVAKVVYYEGEGPTRLEGIKSTRGTLT